MSKICWFDGSDHHLAGAGKEEDFDLELDEIEHRISQCDKEKGKWLGRLEANLEDAKWLITGRAPFVDAFQKYPEKQFRDSSRKRTNFSSNLEKICEWEDWCLRPDLTILCPAVLTPKELDQAYAKQKVLNKYFNKHYPKLVFVEWVAEKAKGTCSKILEDNADNAVAKKLQQGLFSLHSSTFLRQC